MALNFLNDALKTQAYILFQPRVLAVSVIYLALERLALTDSLLPPSDSLKHPCFSLFDVNETELSACKKIILTIYNRELDVLLPLTKEELAIFTDSIRSIEGIEGIDIDKEKTSSNTYSTNTTSNRNHSDARSSSSMKRKY